MMIKHMMEYSGEIKKIFSEKKSVRLIDRSFVGDKGGFGESNQIFKIVMLWPQVYFQLIMLTVKCFMRTFY